MCEQLEERRLLSAPVPAIALFANSSSIIAGQAVHAEVDPANTVLGSGTAVTANYKWDFGDTTSGSVNDVLPGFNAAHVYSTPGTYTLTLKTGR